MKRIADAIADWLIKEKITHVFGIIGAGNLALFDAIGKKEKITIVCCHHEQAAAMSSDYFNRIKGRVASICLVTTGAGSSNAITGVLASWMDSTPLMVISGNEPMPFFSVPHSRVIGVQGYDSCQLVRPITKVADQIIAPWCAIPILESALFESMSLRQGPVWVDIPRDVQVMEAE